MFSNTWRVCATTSSPPTRRPVAVDRDDPGDVQEASRADGVREVRDRLGEAVDADLLAAHAASFCNRSA